MKYLLFFLLMAFASNSQADELKANKAAPLFDHLFSINEQWIHYKAAAPNNLASFENDIGRIQKHLELVVSHLGEVETEGLSSNQMTNRNALLDTLKNYAAASVFPTNTYHAKRTPYFIDIYNVHCAVGYLIKASGHDELAQRIHEEHNYNYIKDIKTSGLLEWANTYGFTVGELAWIQPSYVGNPLVAYAGGTNGEVRKIGEHQFKTLSTSSFANVVMGDFTKLGNTDCNGIGYYFEEEWHCMGEGIQGKLYDFESDYFSDSVVVAGNFTHNHKQHGIAFYSLSKGWEFQENPHKGIMIATAIIRVFDKRAIAYYLPAEDKTELWEYKDGEAEHLISINGRVNAYGDYRPTKPELPEGTVIGGAFDSYTRISDSSQHVSHNLLMMYGKYGVETSFEPIPEVVHDTVYTIYNYFTATYIGGRCDTISANGKNCLTKLVDGAFQTVLTSDRFYTRKEKCPCEIRDIVAFKNTDLLIGGQFPVSDMNASGTSLATYNPLSNFLISLGRPQGPVNTLFFDGHDYIFGGEFSSQDRFDKPLDNLGKYFNPANGVQVPEPSDDISIFPNPAGNQFTIHSALNLVFTQIRVSTLSGQTILDRTYEDNLTQRSVDVSSLSPGLYLVSATATTGQKMISKLTIE